MYGEISFFVLSANLQEHESKPEIQLPASATLHVLPLQISLGIKMYKISGNKVCRT